METVKVYSPVNDKNIQKNLLGSPIWTGVRYHESELKDAQANHPVLYEYHIKFDGLKPVQNTVTKKLVN